MSLGSQELSSIVEEGKPITVECHFCDKTYTFSVEELEALRSRGMEK